MEQEGLTLLQLAKHLGVGPKRILDFEYNGRYQPLFRRKGRRTVRVFPPALAEMIGNAVKLIQQGYGPRLAFFMARKGEKPNPESPKPKSEGTSPCL